MATWQEILGMITVPLTAGALTVYSLLGGCESKTQSNEPQTRPVASASEPLEWPRRDLEHYEYTSREDMLTELNPYIGQTGTQGNPYYPEFGGPSIPSTVQDHTRRPIEPMDETPRGGEGSTRTTPAEPTAQPTNLETFLEEGWDEAEVQNIDGKEYRQIDITGQGSFFVDTSAYNQFKQLLRNLDADLRRSDGHGIRSANELASICTLIGDNEFISANEVNNLARADHYGALFGDMRDRVYNYH